MYKIKWMDAIDLFSKGGYFDLELGRYIVPKWFALLCEENDMGVSDSAYQIMELSNRYLKPPILHLTGCLYLTALKMGSLSQVLQDNGFSNRDYQKPLTDRKPGDNEKWLYELDDLERTAIRNVLQTIRNNGKYWDYLVLDKENTFEIIGDWLSQHDLTPWE